MTVKELIGPYISPLQERLYRSVLEELDSAFREWPRADAVEGDHPDIAATEFLTFFIRNEIENIIRMRRDFDSFNANYSRTLTGSEKRQHILNYARTLGASKKDLRKDKKALDRWFGHDAIQERFLVHIGRAEQRICFCLDRLFDCITIPREDHLPMEEPLVLWHRIQPESLIVMLIEHSGNRYVLEPALKFLARIMELLPAPVENGPAIPGLSDELMQTLYRFTLEEKQPLGVKTSSLRILLVTSGDDFKKLLLEKLRFFDDRDAIFIRRECVKILGDALPRYPELTATVNQLMSDPSPYVRQELARSVSRAPAEHFRKFSRYLAQRDSAPQVRAVMLLEIGCMVRNRKEIEHCRHLLSRVLLHEKNEFVSRVAIKVARDSAMELLKGKNDNGNTTEGNHWIDILLPVLTAMRRQAESLVIRRNAARAEEFFRLLNNPDAMRLYSYLKETAERIEPGTSRRLLSGYFRQYDDQTVGRVMALAAGEDYGLSMHKGRFYRHLYRGHEFRFRWWRFWYELRHSSPDKRQGFSHTRGRYFHGEIHAPSNLLAELTETKVPGEPLVIPAEQGWRPYLPLTDHALSTLKLFGPCPPHKLFTPEGMTEIVPPPSLFKRAAARFTLTFRFSHYASLRNWTEDRPGNPGDYINALERLGFKITFHPYWENGESIGLFADPQVKRFFPAMAFGLPSFSEIWERIKDYFVSLYENSFLELVLFTGAAVVIFFGRHLFLNARHRKIRRQIPLIIGGWGTRGKSGTERLKAALMNSLGLGVVSKTTGSDATFLHAWPFGQLYEIPLFRPYEKATIWEQQDVTRIASGLNAEVLLWECMALQPEYVDVLQQNWMKDDLATITNTYPDHEDVMGPAGIDIPEVMTRFIPPNSRLITSEEQMLPILKEGARRAGSSVRTVGWLQAGLLTDDVLQRFPYNEHPYNIALVLSLGWELGIDRDKALMEMADRVVAEIGMLKTFPRARVDNVFIEFTNGMAANERIGLLSNWQRMGFDSRDLHREPHVFISTVVNNRADRIPRSQVFARILARDIGADRHFLIGSNLTGLKGYIRDAWHEYVEDIFLFMDQTDSQNRAAKLLETLVNHFRITSREDTVKKRLQIMIDALAEPGTDPLPIDVRKLWQNLANLDTELQNNNVPDKIRQKITAQLKSDLESFNAVTHWQRQIQNATPDRYDSLNKEFRQFLGAHFEKKIVVIWDFYAPGDAVVQQIANQTPPGFLNRVMGVQNIKGTGFDFVARWQAWEQCYKALELLESEDESDIAIGLSQLVATTGFGLLGKYAVKTGLETFKHTPSAQNERVQAQLMIIENQFDKAMIKVNESITKETQKKGPLLRAIDWIEGFLDAGDAVKRKKKALRIYEDLTTQRISHPRAIEELQKLNKRQKGGWLSTQILSALGFFKR